ncbi:hypothetical protein EFA69_19480 [Rufibacter immobilis]|uniref:Uncharacterized protein n=1 Tax=Rufibacter immobilis TaxID=1348778 RepID=A0A3M9MSQ8_9BACT|nr:hypothetical protein [Rufibacter immobilis]RNI28247.1 hypothetical protein EFA69_19480 [Rufibacter immobilis]
MENIYGSSLKAHQYLPPVQPVTVNNLAVAIRLSRMGYGSDYITEFVTGPWSPISPGQNEMPKLCPELSLPGRKQE